MKFHVSKPHNYSKSFVARPIGTDRRPINKRSTKSSTRLYFPSYLTTFCIRTRKKYVSTDGLLLNLLNACGLFMLAENCRYVNFWELFSGISGPNSARAEPWEYELVCLSMLLSLKMFQVPEFRSWKVRSKGWLSPAQCPIHFPSLRYPIRR